jgi:hypothetical protein
MGAGAKAKSVTNNLPIAPSVLYAGIVKIMVKELSRIKSRQALLQVLV